MLYNSEITFIGKFIATLKIGGVAEIPFDTPSFYNGVDFMSKFFHTNRDVLGEVSDEIAMLFIKNPFEGIYKRFRDAISAQNGEYMSFVNPEYEVGIVKITLPDARYILGKRTSTISNEFMISCTSEFCKGADLNFNN